MANYNVMSLYFMAFSLNLFLLSFILALYTSNGSGIRRQQAKDGIYILCIGKEMTLTPL